MILLLSSDLAAVRAAMTRWSSSACAFKAASDSSNDPDEDDTRASSFSAALARDVAASNYI
jgi:hypothetical protein